jgi:transcriptional regulator with XRE-family HTH domain
LIFKKNNTNMTAIRKIRKAAGMTQGELAMFLDVSTSLVSMVERNQRQLPTQAWILLSELEAKYVDMQQEESYSHDERAAAVELCQQEAVWCLLKERKLIKELNQMKRRYVYYQEAWRQATQQLEESAGGASEKVIKSKLNYLALQLEKRSLKHQLKQHLHIASMQARRANALALLEEYRI